MASHILTFMMISKLKFLRFQLEIFIHIFGGWVKGTSDKKIWQHGGPKRRTGSIFKIDCNWKSVTGINGASSS